MKRTATIRGGGAMRRLAAAREGSSLAEFALIVPLLLLIVTAVIEFGMVMFVVALTERCAMRRAGASPARTSPG